MINKKANAGAWVGGGLGAVGGYASKDKKETTMDGLKRAAVGGLAGAVVGNHIHSAGKQAYRDAARGRSGGNAWEQYSRKAGGNSSRSGSTGGNKNTGGSTGGNKNTGGSTGGNKNTGGSTGGDNGRYTKARDKYNSEFNGMSPDEAKRHYRKAAGQHHPDRGGHEEDFKGLGSAYEAFKKRHGK